ncbi:MAG: hypothetical protein M3380_20030, partial [Chloroflexota bacterium]|nr:hypothetical protein [Chloroflexota bacterium]
LDRGELDTIIERVVLTQDDVSRDTDLATHIIKVPTVDHRYCNGWSSGVERESLYGYVRPGLAARTL